VAYTKQTWADGPTGGTPLDSVSLNHIEDGIEAAAATADTAASSAASALDAAAPVAASAAAILNSTNGVNTAGKSAGLMVYNTTAGKPCWATGPNPTDGWVYADGTSVGTMT
jgi:hypothetical protein